LFDFGIIPAVNYKAPVRYLAVYERAEDDTMDEMMQLLKNTFHDLFPGKDSIVPAWLTNPLIKHAKEKSRRKKV
jgi:hypothetical protein